MFSQSAAAQACGPGHNSFFTSPDETEDWFVYHANSEPGDGCGGERSSRMQQFYSTKMDPRFGEPVGLGAMIRYALS